MAKKDTIENFFPIKLGECEKPNVKERILSKKICNQKLYIVDGIFGS